jgi:hypothetical protein
VQRRPIKNESEKLRVARVDSESPRRRREKDLMRWYCWGMRGFDTPKPFARIAASESGRRTFTPSTT